MAFFPTLRLDEKTRKSIALLARRNKITGSEVVRRAIEAWVESHPYETISDLIGVVRGGNLKRSAEIQIEIWSTMTVPLPHVFHKCCI